MRGVAHILAAACLLFAFLGTSVAQKQKPSSAPPAFSVTSRLVSVDVVVLDGQGNVVHGLKQDDFKVAEDGRSQDIASFIDHTGGPDAATTTGPETKGFQFSNMQGAVHGRAVNMILFDLQNTRTLEQPYARKQMIQFLEGLPPGGQTALFVLTAQLRMIQGFTSSTDALVAAARAMTVEPSMLVKSEAGRQREGDQMTRLSAAAGRSPAAIRLGEALANEEILADRSRSQTTASALEQIAEASSGYSGRKNLFWLSSSFPVGLGATLQLDSTVARLAVPGAAEAASMLASSQVAVYPISVQGVTTGGVGAEASGEAATNGGDAMGGTLARQFDERYVLRTSMESLADQTGGEAFYSTNDLAGALRRGFSRGDSFYTLEYRPSRRDWDGSYRHIAVKLRQKGYRLFYRQGYYAAAIASSGGSGESMRAALQQGNVEATGIPLSANVTGVKEPAPGARVDALLGASAVMFTGGTDGLMRAKLLLMLATRQPDGKAVAAPHETSALMNLALEPQDYAAVMKSGLPFHLTLADVPEGVALRLGVRDLTTGRIGTLDLRTAQAR